MEPSEIRTRLLAEHHQLMLQILAVRRLMADAGGRAPWSRALRKAIEELMAALAAHMLSEESLLEPALAESTNWGEVNLAELRAHHEGQRAQVRALLVEMWREDHAPGALHERLMALLHEIAVDIEEENAHLLTPRMLRDDVTAIDASGG